MNAKDILSEIVSSMQEPMNLLGFKKNEKQYIFISKEGNWGIVDFQKSSKSSNDAIVFTVNLGVSSKKLLSAYSNHSSKRPSIWDCQWQIRLGHIMEEKKDIWWTVTKDTDIQKLSLEILNILLVKGIPEIKKYIDDASLCDLWLSGISPSLTDTQRMRYLDILRSR